MRVNDLELTKVREDYHLINLDIGWRSLLRRLDVGNILVKILSLRRRALPTRLAWSDIEPLPSREVRLKVPRSRIADLHPADIAEILSSLMPRAGGNLIGALDDEMAADALEEFEPKFQASMLKTLDDERAADVLEAMTPDDAADLLSKLSPEERETPPPDGKGGARGG